MINKKAYYNDIITCWNFLKTQEEYDISTPESESASATKTMQAASELYNVGSSFLRKLVMACVDALEQDATFRKIHAADVVKEAKSD